MKKEHASLIKHLQEAGKRCPEEKIFFDAAITAIKELSIDISERCRDECMIPRHEMGG